MNSLKHPLGNEFLRTGAWRRLWIVTGGQTGVDRAAMDVALELKLPLRGWCPKEREAEDGQIASVYPLQETSTTDPALRTELNVIDSDGTLVLNLGRPKDGTPLTVETASLHNRPLLELPLDGDPALLRDTFRSWVERGKIKVLNIAGPRESFSPGTVYRLARPLLIAFLKQ